MQHVSLILLILGAFESLAVSATGLLQQPGYSVSGHVSTFLIASFFSAFVCPAHGISMASDSKDPEKPCVRPVNWWTGDPVVRLKLLRNCDSPQAQRQCGCTENVSQEPLISGRGIDATNEMDPWKWGDFDPQQKDPNTQATLMLVEVSKMAHQAGSDDESIEFAANLLKAAHNKGLVDRHMMPRLFKTVLKMRESSTHGGYSTVYQAMAEACSWQDVVTRLDRGPQILNDLFTSAAQVLQVLPSMEAVLEDPANNLPLREATIEKMTYDIACSMPAAAIVLVGKAGLSDKMANFLLSCMEYAVNTYAEV